MHLPGSDELTPEKAEAIKNDLLSKSLHNAHRFIVSSPFFPNNEELKALEISLGDVMHRISFAIAVLAMPHDAEHPFTPDDSKRQKAFLLKTLDEGVIKISKVLDGIKPERQKLFSDEKSAGVEAIQAIELFRDKMRDTHERLKPHVPTFQAEATGVAVDKKLGQAPDSPGLGG